MVSEKWKGLLVRADVHQPTADVHQLATDVHHPADVPLLAADVHQPATGVRQPEAAVHQPDVHQLAADVHKSAVPETVTDQLPTDELRQTTDGQQTMTEVFKLAPADVQQHEQHGQAALLESINSGPQLTQDNQQEDAPLNHSSIFSQESEVQAITYLLLYGGGRAVFVQRRPVT
jgi:hypothetical protein